MKRLQNEIDKATFSSSSKRVKIIYSKYSINFASASSLNPRSLFNESPIKNLSFTERERKRESRNQNRIAEFHRGNKSPNLQDQSINRQIYLVYSQKKLWNRTWWWMWNSSCSFIVQITENHTVGSFRNSRQRDKRCKRYSTIRRGPFTLGGVRFLHEFPEEESACTRVLRPRSLSQWWLRWKNKSSSCSLDSCIYISFDFLIRNTGFEMEDWNNVRRLLRINWKFWYLGDIFVLQLQAHNKRSLFLNRIIKEKYV